MTEKKGIALALHDWKILFEDDWKSLTIALYMVLVGYGVLVGIPVIGGNCRFAQVFGRFSDFLAVCWTRTSITI